MVDVIFVVRDAQQWHSVNMDMHPEHYSGLARLGATAVAGVQGLPAGLYFNTSVPLPGAQGARLLKYGVISLPHFMQDLRSWTWLYAAGRLHKPVRFLQSPPPAVRQALRANVTAASAAALLMLPCAFPLLTMLQQITALSYTGDFRMTLGENPHKVTNIVATNTHHFNKLFFQSEHQLAALGDMGLQLPGCQLPAVAAHNLGAATMYSKHLTVCEHSASTTAAAFERLPRAFRQRCLLQAGAQHGEVSQLLQGSRPLPPRAHLAAAVQRTIRRAVAPAAAVQSVKGVFTAGPAKSAAYALAKLQKQLRGLMRR